MIDHFPTEEELEDSLNKNVLALQKFKHLIREAESLCGILLEPGLTETDQVILLQKVGEDISTIVSRHAACRNGCSHCCNMATALSYSEAKFIGNHIGKDPALTAKTMTRERMVAKYHNVPCPFLEGGSCSIYEVRPFSCRTYFNLTDYPALCDLTNHPGTDVPSINLIVLWGVYGAVMEDSPLGDIRQFFPHGRNNSI